MKYLVLLVVLVVAYMMWRNARLEQRRDAPPPPGGKPAASPQDMVRCPVCSVHLPRGDAVAGADGLMYCSQEHRLQDGR